MTLEVDAMTLFAGIDHLGLFMAAGILLKLTPSSTAFSFLKWLGAAYLVYVGWTMLISGSKRDTPDSIAIGPISTGATGQNYLNNVFIKRFWNNALNPKAALFFLAFLPQFITPGAEHQTVAFLLLGLVFNFNGLWVNLAYAALGAAVSRRLAPLQQGGAWLQRLAGVMFIGFGLKLALTDNPPS
jgi:threonine/homoserine/homoserine lactone efflux protein